jgi:hypothetical protein
VLVGLNWGAISDHLADADDATAARVKDLMSAIEAGALAADSTRRAGESEG